MTKYLLLLIMTISTLSVSLSAQTQESDPLQEPPVAESMEDAMSEINKLMESFDLSSFFGDSTMIQGFGGQDINGLIDSMGLDQFDHLFKEGTPNMQNLDLGQLDKMMEGIDMSQMMQMLEGIDMSQMQKMMEGIDMSEIMKMFEGMDMQGLEKMMPAMPNQEEIPTKDGKKLKRI